MNSCYQLCDHRAGPDHSYLMQNLTGVGKGKGLNIGHWRKWTPVTHMKCNPFNSQGISRVFEWDIILGQDNKGKWALLLLCSIVCICRDTPQHKRWVDIPLLVWAGEKFPSLWKEVGAGEVQGRIVDVAREWPQMRTNLSWDWGMCKITLAGLILVSLKFRFACKIHISGYYKKLYLPSNRSKLVVQRNKERLKQDHDRQAADCTPGHPTSRIYPCFEVEHQQLVQERRGGESSRSRKVQFHQKHIFHLLHNPPLTRLLWAGQIGGCLQSGEIGRRGQERRECA